jgi:outer membrane protein OmpA-like peptidoglycan-associated protein
MKNIALVCLVLAACASPKISLEQFGGVADIPEGEEATVYWTFANADSVTVSGEDVKYGPSDKFFPRPKMTTTYHVTGYKMGGDSLSQDWTVRVYPTKKTQGAAILGSPENKQTTPQLDNIPKEINYLRSVNRLAQPSPIAESNAPAFLKIMRAVPPSENEITAKLSVALFDKQGNFSHGFDQKDDAQLWSSMLHCGDISSEPISQSAIEQTAGGTIAIGLAMDRSLAMSPYITSAFASVENFLPALPVTDYMDFLTYNHTVTEAVPLTTADSVRSIFTYLAAPPANGLSSLYKATRLLIDKLRVAPSERKAAVIITASSDNSSLLTTAEHTLQLSRNSHIPVYVIAIGDGSADTYTLRYITNSTGGRLYHVSPERVHDISDILTEILQSQKAYYEISLPVAGNSAPCLKPNATIKFASPSGNLQEKVVLAPDSLWESPAYQAVALFEKNNAILDNTYQPLIVSLAVALKDNPEKFIELIGHSSNDNSDDDAIGLAIQRTQAVRRALLAQGVAASQIRTRAVGNRKPLYYIEQESWQKIANRRVELRWLDPALLPIEIAAEQVASEEEALKMTERWEQRGQKAYYERVIINKIPSYRVKLWGYSTLTTAKDAAKQLQKQYKMTLQVE